MSGYNSSDDEKEEDLQLASSSGNPKAGGSSNYLRSVVRQQQDATKTCRLLALEVGSLKAELAREQKKRAQAVHRAVTAEATQQQAEQRLQELQYSNNKLQQEVDAAHKASEANSRRVNSLRQSLADVEAEAQDMKVKGQQQVQELGLLASTLQALVTACCCNTHCNTSSSSRGSHLATQLTRGLLEALIQLDRQLAGTPAPAVGADSKPCAVDVTSLIQQAKQFVNQEQQQGWSCRQAPGSPGAAAAAAAAAASPTAGRLQQQQQQQLESLRLQHLAERTAWEGERLQLQQDRAKLQLQLATMQQQCTATDSQLQQLHAEAAAASQQLNAARAEVSELRAALARQRLQGSCSPSAQPWQQQQQQQRELAVARAEVAELRAAFAKQEVAKQQQSAAESAAQLVDAMTSRLANTSLHCPEPQYGAAGDAAGDAADCLASQTAAAAARVAVTAMRFGQAGGSSSRGGAGAGGSPLGPRAAAAAQSAAAAAGDAQHLSPVRTRYEQSPRAAGMSAEQLGANTATGYGGGASNLGYGTARRSLAFQGAVVAAAGAEDGRLPRSQAATSYKSPRAPAAASRTAAAAAGEADRYQQLVREADAALQQLAACRHKAGSAAAPASPAAAAAGAGAGESFSSRQQQQGHSAEYSPRRLYGQGADAFTALGASSAVATAPGSHTTHQIRPHSASLASPLRAHRGLTDAAYHSSSSDGGVCGANRPGAAAAAVRGRVGLSGLRASCSPSFSRQLLEGCQPGSDFGGRYVPAKTSPAWSPGRRRVGSPGQATAAAAMTVGLQGELQALDQDIAAAEASLQAAVIRLGAAAGPA